MERPLDPLFPPARPTLREGGGRRAAGARALVALVPLLAGLGGAAACTPEECQVGNEELSMTAVVVDNGSTVRAEVDFAVGDRGSIAIPWRRCDGDSIRINGRDAEETVKRDRVEYSLTTPADRAPDTFTFELGREDGDVRAFVELPPPFEITAPEPLATLSRGEELVIAWAPSDASQDMRIQLEERVGDGFCLMTAVETQLYKRRGGIAVADEGAWAIPPGTLAGDEACQAIYRLTRVRAGDYPAELAPGGYIESRVVRAVSFVSVP